MTAPPSLTGKKGDTLKRGAPTIWELQESMAAHAAREASEGAEGVGATVELPQAPATWGRAHGAHLLSSYRQDLSEDSESVVSESMSESMSEDGRDPRAASASWPRVRKQRTGKRGSLSLWEVSEALESAGPAQPALQALPSPGSLDAKTLEDLGADLSFVDNMFVLQSPSLAPAVPPASREDSMGVTELGVDLSKISCSAKADAGPGPTQLAHHMPTGQPPMAPEDALQPNPHDWDALAHDSPTSNVSDEAMQFSQGGQAGGEALAHSEPEALAMLQALAEEGKTEQQGGRQLDMEQAMQMDPGELLASLLPDARSAGNGWHEALPNGLPSPSTLQSSLAPPGVEVEGCTTPPMVPHSAEMPRAGLVLPPTMVTLPADGAFAPAAAERVGLSIEKGQLVPAAGAAGSRNGPERKEWTAAEDEIIQSGVAMFGCKWRRIAAQLPGRSDDAVRNRWNRLKEAKDGALPVEGAEGEPAPAAPRRRVSGGGRKQASPEGPAGAPAAEGGAGAKGAKPERMSWTKVEDATIVSGVQELGHKWYQIAQRLPGRTDHAIRNRYHRLQAMMQDQLLAVGGSGAAGQEMLPTDGAAGQPPLAISQRGPLEVLQEEEPNGMGLSPLSATAAFPVGGFE